VLPLPDIAAALVALTGPGRHFDPEREGRPEGPTPARKNGKQAGHSDRDKVIERVRARRDRVAGLLARTQATPTAPDLLEAAVAELGACSEALGVRGDVITPYCLALKAEAAGPPAC